MSFTTVCMNQSVCLIRLGSPFVAAVNGLHHPTLIDLRFDVYDDASALSRPRAICQITVEVHAWLRGSVLATIQSYHCDMNEPLLWILIDDQDTLWDTAMSKIDERSP